MFELADGIVELPEHHQFCMALCVAERVLVAKGLFASDQESSLVNGLYPIVDELWETVINGHEMDSGTYDRLRVQINDCRPLKIDDNPEFRFRDVCWILKSVLKVFRGREHAFEITRLGDAMAALSLINTNTEAENQQQMFNQISRMPEINAASVDRLRELVRTMRIDIGDVERDLRD